jgi:hypothetical protein
VSQIVLDDQLFDLEVLVPLARWITVQRLRDLRPGEVIKDDRVPQLLRQLRQPTFVTIDMGFWDKTLRDPRYCLLCFPLSNDEQFRLPELLRRLFQLPEFHTKAARMGKVVRVGTLQIDYWQPGEQRSHRLNWPASI